MTICGDYAYMIGYTADAKSHAAETPLAFWVNISNGTMGLNQTLPTLLPV